MTDTRERYILQKFPIFVDPLVRSLEILVTKCRVGSDGSRESVSPPVWKQLQRVRVAHDTFPFAVESSMISFFGPEERASQCPYLLVYDAAGVIRFRIEKQDKEFIAYQLPEEVNGRVVLKSTVRVSFDSAIYARQFLATVENLQSGRNPDRTDLDFLIRLLRGSTDATLVVIGRDGDVAA